MTRRLQPPAVGRLADPVAERVRQVQDRRIRELQDQIASSLTVIRSVELADGVETPVAHGLGRPPAWVKESCVRGAASTGRVEEVRSGSNDRARVVTLLATGWGATITVDVLVL